MTLAAEAPSQSKRDCATAALGILNKTLEQRVEERTGALPEAEEALRQAQTMEALGSSAM